MTTWCSRQGRGWVVRRVRGRAAGERGSLAPTTPPSCGAERMHAPQRHTITSLRSMHLPTRPPTNPAGPTLSAGRNVSVRCQVLHQNGRRPVSWGGWEGGGGRGWEGWGGRSGAGQGAGRRVGGEPWRGCVGTAPGRAAAGPPPPLKRGPTSASEGRPAYPTSPPTPRLPPRPATCAPAGCPRPPASGRRTAGTTSGEGGPGREGGVGGRGGRAGRGGAGGRGGREHSLPATPPPMPAAPPPPSPRLPPSQPRAPPDPSHPASQLHVPGHHHV